MPAPADIRIVRSATGEDPHAWRRALTAFDERRAETLKRDTGTAVFCATLLGRAVILKQWDLPSAGARLKSLLGVTRAHRHWRAAAWLAAHGFATARCFALLTGRTDSRAGEWLVMEALDGKTLLQHLADNDLPVRDQHALARALGRQISELTKLARSNRDHKPSNLIVLRGREPSIAIIDCVAIQRRVDPRRMLASLAIEPAGCALPIRRALAMRVISTFADGPAAARPLTRDDRRRRRHDLWRAVSTRIRAHGDPRPRINPLAPT